MSYRKRACFLNFLSLFFALLFLVSCAGGVNHGITAPETSDKAPQETSKTAAETTGGETMAEPGAEQPFSKTPETLKILAVGNSFSTDAMQYLYDIAKDAGVKEIVLGNLYIGGCSLETHLSHAKSGTAAYTYYKNNSGSWIAEEKVTFLHGLCDEDWDYISLQQASNYSGISSSYGKTLISLIGKVETQKTNPEAKLVWHMTWAYQQNSTHSAFPNYGSSQTKMYEMIVDAVKSQVVPTGDFAVIIPAGTAVQNARTGFTGDTLTRDGHHLSLTLGRYIAALCWYAAITGADIADIAYIPSADITPEVMAMAKEAAANSILTPYEVTASSYKTGSLSASPASGKTAVLSEDCREGDKALAASVGVDLDGYVLFDYDYSENSYYYSTNGTSVTKPAVSNGNYLKFICTAEIYSKTEIPENSIIICDAGWQYRPEWWVSLSRNAASRPALTSAAVTLLNKAWWGQNAYLALNICAKPAEDISGYYNAAASHVRLYVPKSE